ncbi:MAG TPA: endo alpha-1,4 polygalactosaminidase [Niastella sp.]
MNTIRTRYLWIAAFLVFGTACQKKTNEDEPGKDAGKIAAAVDTDQEMRTFIQDLSAYARQQKPGFLIVPQDGLSMLSSNGTNTGTPVASYLAAIDGVGQEEVYFGYDNEDDTATPASASNEYQRMLRFAESNGKPALVTDYCTTPWKIDTSYARNFRNGFASYAATARELDNIATATPYNVHAGNVNSLSDAKNFLYLINPQHYLTKKEYLDALRATNFDVFILDGFFNDDDSALSAAEVQSLKIKANGGKRIVLAYVAVGHAEDYRGYWNPDWLTNPPAWLHIVEDPNWEGNYPVRYWMPEWKSIVYGNNTSYIKRFTNTGFDGAYLDTYDYKYWDN